MKNYFLWIFLLVLISGCEKEEKNSAINSVNWSKRKISLQQKDSLEFGKSYLSVYSQIYSMSEHKTHNLTVLVSLRNISDTDTIYVTKATYYDTHGKIIRKYFDFPIYMVPMETTEIIINEIDTSGGTGSNFMFEWKTPKNCPEPLFEGIMNSTMGQQGLSFTTQGKRIK